MPDNPISRVSRVAYGARETSTKLLDADSFASFVTDDGFLTLELHRVGKRASETLESYRFEFCPEDEELVWRELSERRRRRNAMMNAR
jgi:hypothetical protein